MGKLIHYKPEDILRPEWVPEYNKELHAIYDQLVMLNHNIYVLEKIINFPYRLFNANTRFFGIITSALFEASIMIAWRVAFDSNSEALTIKSFQAHIFKNLKSDEYKEPLREDLKKYKQKYDLAKTEKIIKDVRNEYLAHLNLEWYLESNQMSINERIVRLEHLKQVRDAINDNFSIFWLDNEFLMVYPEYLSKDHPLSCKEEDDVDQLLNMIARNSTLLNMPETDIEHWKIRKNRLTDDEKIVLNSYRVKFGLSLVD